MTTVNIPQYQRQALQSNLKIRNGTTFYPDASTTTYLQEETNRILRWCTKSWSFAVPMSAIPAAGGGGSLRVRARAYLHTSSHHSFMWCRFVTAPSNSTTNPFIQATFTNVSDLTTADAYFYSGNQSNADAPTYFAKGDTATNNNGASVVQLSPDTDYTLDVYDNDNARLIALCVYEISLPSDTDNGYLNSGVQAGGPIFDNHRGDMVPLLRTAWKRNASPLITWCVDLDTSAPTSNGATKNVVDTSVTGVSAASPGFTLDMRNKSTVRRASSGVPCIMRAYHKTSIGGGANTANVLLKDSSGTTLATCTTTSTTEVWTSSGAFYLPATLSKYDLMLNQSNFGVHTLYAVSLYQYES